MTDSGATPSPSSPERPQFGPQPAFAGPPGPSGNIATTRPQPGTAVSVGTDATRPSGPFELALKEFWQGQQLPMSHRTLIACGAVGLAAAVLLVGHEPGLGAAIVALLVWAVAVPQLVRRRAIGDLVTAALSVALVGVVAVRDAEWVVALCFLAAIGTAAVAATSARSVPAVVLSVASGFAGTIRALPWVGRGLGTAVGSRKAQLMVALRTVATTLVLLLVFGLLFASADAVFASYLPEFDLGTLPARVVVGVLVALAAATLSYLALAPPGWSDLSIPRGRPARRAEWLLPILALDAMVLAFVIVQVGALLGGHRHVLETAGLTYAEYTREGFAQLVVATALTLVVVAVAARRAPRVTERDRLITRIALGVLCVGTLGVVASALRRMDLYVDAFGLTRLRMFVVVVELVLGVVLVLVLVAGIRWRGGWLPRVVVQVAAVAMLALAAVNPDAQIVRHNATADLDAGIDVVYLEGLSADALPAMDALDEPLRSCLLVDSQAHEQPGFADWNLGRARAASTAAELDAEGRESPDGMTCVRAVAGD